MLVPAWQYQLAGFLKNDLNLYVPDGDFGYIKDRFTVSGEDILVMKGKNCDPPKIIAKRI